MAGGIGGVISGILGSDNEFEAKKYEDDANAFEYGGVAGGADAAANRYMEQGNAAAMQAGVADLQQNAARDAQMGALGSQRGALGSLQDAMGLQRNAAMGNAPSRAEILGRQQSDQAASAQQSLAASARGPAAMALAQQNAAANTANAQTQIAGSAMAQRADEMANARNAYQSGASAYGQGAASLQQGAGSIRGQDLTSQQGARGQQMGMTQAEQNVRGAQLNAGMNREQLRSSNYNAAQGINAGVEAGNAATNGQMATGAIKMGADLLTGSALTGSTERMKEPVRSGISGVMASPGDSKVPVYGPGPLFQDVFMTPKQESQKADPGAGGAGGIAGVMGGAGGAGAAAGGGVSAAGAGVSGGAGAMGSMLGGGGAAGGAGALGGLLGGGGGAGGLGMLAMLSGEGSKRSLMASPGDSKDPIVIGTSPVEEGSLLSDDLDGKTGKTYPTSGVVDLTSQEAPSAPAVNSPPPNEKAGRHGSVDEKTGKVTWAPGAPAGRSGNVGADGQVVWNSPGTPADAAAKAGGAKGGKGSAFSALDKMQAGRFVVPQSTQMGPMMQVQMQPLMASPGDSKEPTEDPRAAGVRDMMSQQKAQNLAIPNIPRSEAEGWANGELATTKWEHKNLANAPVTVQTGSGKQFTAPSPADMEAYLVSTRGASYAYKDPNMPGANQGPNYGPPAAEDMQTNPVGQMVTTTDPRTQNLAIDKDKALKANMSSVAYVNDKVNSLAAVIGKKKGKS